MKDNFKVQGIKKTYNTIPEFLKAGARQYRTKKRKLMGYAYSPGMMDEEVGYFTADPYSDDVLFMGFWYYDANGDKSLMPSYRISKSGAIRSK